jgi:hypothetical protein
MYIYIYMYMYIYTHTHTHTCIHTYIHAYINIHIRGAGAAARGGRRLAADKTARFDDTGIHGP